MSTQWLPAVILLALAAGLFLAAKVILKYLGGSSGPPAKPRVDWTIGPVRRRR